MDVMTQERSAAAGRTAGKNPDGADAAPRMPGPRPDGRRTAFGEIVWLLSQSHTHRHLFLADLEWLVMPPIQQRKFWLFHDGKQLAGVALWASVSDEVEKELVAGRTRLKLDEWDSGDRPWLIELVTVPGRAAATRQMLAELSTKIFCGKAFRMRVRDPKTGAAKVVIIKDSASATGSEV